MSSFTACAVLITFGGVEARAVASVSDRFLCAEIEWIRQNDVKKWISDLLPAIFRLLQRFSPQWVFSTPLKSCVNKCYVVFLGLPRGLIRRPFACSPHQAT